MDREETITLPAQTVVKLRGMPFRLIADTDVAGRRENLMDDQQAEGGFVPLSELVECPGCGTVTHDPSQSTLVVEALKLCLSDLERLNKTIGWRDGEWHSVTVAKDVLSRHGG